MMFKEYEFFGFPDIQRIVDENIDFDVICVFGGYKNIHLFLTQYPIQFGEKHSCYSGWKKYKNKIWEQFPQYCIKDGHTVGTYRFKDIKEDEDGQLLVAFWAELFAFGSIPLKDRWFGLVVWSCSDEINVEKIVDIIKNTKKEILEESVCVNI